RRVDRGRQGSRAGIDRASSRRRRHRLRHDAAPLPEVAGALHRRAHPPASRGHPGRHGSLTVVGVDIDLSGRSALVTGGGNGVGAEICAALVRAGAFVWVNDIYEDRAVAVATALGGDEHARPAKADVTSPLKITRMREATGPVDILVNNAGIPTTGSGELKLFVDTHPEDWNDAMPRNLGAVLHATHAYAAAMANRGGWSIVTIVSDARRK